MYKCTGIVVSVALTAYLLSDIFTPTMTTPLVLATLTRPAVPSQHNALVLGATGAVGRVLVTQLLVSPHWTSVTTLTRKTFDVTADEVQHENKLIQKVVDFEHMRILGAKLAGNEITQADRDDPLFKAFEHADVVFNCLGTTRSQAGSAEAFRTVDLHFVVASGQVARAAGVKHFSLVTAQGANANTWACDYAPFHALLYTQTKGRAEAGVIATGIERVSVYRPGLLSREKNDGRMGEKIFVALVPSIPVSVVARAMRIEAESEPISSGMGQTVAYYSNEDMRALAAMT